MNMNMKCSLPFIAMVVAQVAQVGLTLSSKKAIATGMHNFAYIFYSNALAFLVLLPAVFLVHRPPNRPALTFSVVSSFFGLGILGFLMQVIGYAGVTYASATVFTAILNLVPGFVFVFAIIFGLERLDNEGGWFKIIGTVVSVVGALIVTFYKGPTIITSCLSSIAPPLLLGESSNLILGGLLMLIDSVLAALFLIAQALLFKKYSAVLILMSAYCFIIAVLSLLASLILEHDLNSFSLQSKRRLLAILYAGFFGAGFQLTIGSWCMKIKGPLFVTIFQPLGIVIAAIMGILFLGDGLYLGCLIGSAFIVAGFYGVIWGKAKEDKNIDTTIVGSTQAPLLQDGSKDNNVV
uniref:WAT1-related protein At5g40230-like n=1 Tax=Erigeron canadensis TaxID=72917 RepID=UPI001CB90E11|nr:WAT1-related protein At5g40230-like [Erigeron canadensis]